VCHSKRSQCAMPFVAEFYDPDTLKLMTRALKEAMQESAGQAPPRGEFNIVMANRIMTAVVAGERDLDALKRAALSAADTAPKSAA
jgi:hypothetical protein